jgi:hypothetical protein
VEGGDVYRVPLSNVDLDAASIMAEDKRVGMATRLINVGFDPAQVLAAFDLPPMEHTGLPSVQLQAPTNVDPENPTDLYPVRTRRVERDEQGFITRIIDEPTSEDS